MRASARWGSPMSYAIRIWSLVGYQAGEDPPAAGSFPASGGNSGGRYLASYDPDGNNGFGDLALTADPGKGEALPKHDRRSRGLPPQQHCSTHEAGRRAKQTIDCLHC